MSRGGVVPIEEKLELRPKQNLSHSRIALWSTEAYTSKEIDLVMSPTSWCHSVSLAREALAL